MVPLGRQIMAPRDSALRATQSSNGRSGSPTSQGPAVARRSASRHERYRVLRPIDVRAHAFVVPGFNPGMPAINRPPIALTDQEILIVMAYLQSLGGTPTVTLQTSHRFYTPAGAAPPGEGAAPASAPAAPGTAPAATGAAVPLSRNPSLVRRCSHPAASPGTGARHTTASPGRRAGSSSRPPAQR